MASGVVLCRVVRIASRENFLFFKLANKLTQIWHENMHKTCTNQNACDLTLNVALGVSFLYICDVFRNCLREGYAILQAKRKKNQQKKVLLPT